MANNHRAMRFWLGLFVLASLLLLGGLVLIFGSFPTLFERTDPYTILFPDAPGVAVNTPVRRSGIRIGAVRAVQLDDETGKVRVLVGIDRTHTVRRYEVPTLITGILGSDTSIDFLPQTDVGPPDMTPVPPGSVLIGVRQASVNTLIKGATEVVPSTQEALQDLRNSMKRLEQMAPLMEDTLREYRDLARIGREMAPELRETNREVRDLARATRDQVPAARQALDDLAAASRSVLRLSERLDVLLQANQDKLVKVLDNLNEVLTRAASLLSEENVHNINAILKNVRTASDRFDSIANNGDELLKESRKTMRHLDGTLTRTDEVLTNLQQATKPWAERGPSILRNLDESLDKLNRTLADTNEILRVVGQSNGTLNRILTDPSLYNHVDEAACQIVHLIPRVDRILKDMETFADKLARHPEALGIGGVVRPGSGLKDPPR